MEACVHEIFDPVTHTEFWHYTSVEALYGIIESGEFWATSATRLNDPTEFEYGFSIFSDLVGEECKSLLEKHGDDAAYAVEFFQRLTDKKVLIDVLERLFVLSASQQCDSLPQWVHYAGTSGVAIAIEDNVGLYTPGQHKRLVEGGRHPRSEIGDWTPLLYGENDVSAALRGEISNLTGDHQLVTQSEDQNKEVQAEIVMTFLRDTLLRAKHGAFDSEAEWRYIVLPSPPERPRFRAKGNDLVPYMPLRSQGETPVGIPRLPITKVKVGPTAGPQLEQTLKAYLNAKGYDRVLVDRSGIPYRS